MNTRSTARTTFSSSLQVPHYILISCHMRVSSRELPSLPKTNLESEGSGKATSLMFKNHTHNQSSTCSLI